MNIKVTWIGGYSLEEPLCDSASAIDEYSKDRLLGYIFEHDNLNLNRQSRKFATACILSEIPGSDPQLLAHLINATNIGLSDNQLQQII